MRYKLLRERNRTPKDIAKIKQAFWETFHGSGELWFPYSEDEEECNASTNNYWEDFLANLQKSYGNDLGQSSTQNNPNDR